MPTSEARIAANRASALKSTGPKTPEGKLASRSNALKHGLTGEGVVIPAEDVAEVERKAAAFGMELGARGEVGHELARRMAVLAVRMDRSARQEFASVAENTRKALDEFEAPEGVTDPATIARLRAEAGQRAAFDPSKEAILARKYEAAAERGFYKALRELRQARVASEPVAEVVKPARPVEHPEDLLRAEALRMVAARKAGTLGSFLPGSREAPKAPAPSLPNPVGTPPSLRSEPARGAFEVPISIGLAR